MIVQWAFRRGDERAFIDIVRTDAYYVVHVREPNGERWLTAATVLDALLEQADAEHALTRGGWDLADFVRSRRPRPTRSQSGVAWAAGDALPLTTLSVGREMAP